MSRHVTTALKAVRAGQGHRRVAIEPVHEMFVQGAKGVPELHQLRYFVEVADQHSFSRAAEALHLSQSAISQQMSALEREYRCTLFIRRREGVELTAAGIVLEEHARRVLATLGETDTAMMQLGPMPRGTRLRLGSSVGPLLHLLPGLLAAFSDRHPGLSFTVTLGSTVAICAKVLRGGLDVGIANMPVPDGLGVHPVYEDDLTLIVSKGHPLTGYTQVPPSALRGLPFVSLPRRHPVADCIAAICHEVGFAPDVVLETDNGELIREFVARGLAVAVVPSLLMQTVRDPRIVRLPIKGQSFVRTLAAITLQETSPDSLVGEFIESLQQHAAPVTHRVDRAARFAPVRPRPNWSGASTARGPVHPPQTAGEGNSSLDTVDI